MVPLSDQPTSGPASALPIGTPEKLSDIETAKARPIQAGSVRRCRIVKSAMSTGPTSSPKMASAAATT